MPALSAADLGDLLLPAVGVMIVGYTDNVLTARAFASRGGQDINANQELLALGISNMTVGLFKGFPVSSSGSRTALGDAAGSRSQMYSLIALTGVVLVLLVGGPVLANFPDAALGAIIMARVKQDLLDDLQAHGLAGHIGPERLFPTLPTAVAAYQGWAAAH